MAFSAFSHNKHYDSCFRSIVKGGLRKIKLCNNYGWWVSLNEIIHCPDLIIWLIRKQCRDWKLVHIVFLSQSFLSPPESSRLLHYTVCLSLPLFSLIFISLHSVNFSRQFSVSSLLLPFFPPLLHFSKGFWGNASNSFVGSGVKPLPSTVCWCIKINWFQYEFSTGSQWRN